MNIEKLFTNPIIIAVLLVFIVGMFIPKTEKFTNDPQVIAATALVQGGATLHQAMKLGVKKEDYMTAMYLVANKID